MERRRRGLCLLVVETKTSTARAARAPVSRSRWLWDDRIRFNSILTGGRRMQRAWFAQADAVSLFFIIIYFLFLIFKQQQQQQRAPHHIIPYRRTISPHPKLNSTKLN